MELNKIYCMDNLELLKQLDDESIDLIYCDILYNTGKKFRDYDDKLGTPQEAIEWYRPRIEEMVRVLKKNGTILIHCDINLVHYIKVYMDGIKDLKFKNDIIWTYSLQSRRTEISNKHDNILRYVKGSKGIYNTQCKPYTEKTLKEYRHVNEKGEKCARVKRKNKDGSYTYYLSPLGEGAGITDVWDDINSLTPSSKERVGYDTQKPKKLLERIISAFSNEGDIVGDFFCGSGTSMVVAKELGRNYIGCDINPRAVEITNKRLNN